MKIYSNVQKVSSLASNLNQLDNKVHTFMTEYFIRSSWKLQEHVGSNWLVGCVVDMKFGKGCNYMWIFFVRVVVVVIFDEEFMELSTLLLLYKEFKRTPKVNMKMFKRFIIHSRVESYPKLKFQVLNFWTNNFQQFRFIHVCSCVFLCLCSFSAS